MRRSIVYVSSAVLLIVILIWVYLPVVSKYRELKIQEEKMTLEIETLTEKVLSLEEEKHLLQNDVNYLERVIRQEMGLVRPGEAVYKIVEEPSEGKPLN